MNVITGATGNTGKVVAKSLLAKDQKDRVIGRSAERLKPHADAGSEAFVCDVIDSEALARAFSDARAIYAMIPPNMASQDFRADQDRITDALALAIEKTGVSHAVALCSIGADKISGTGPVVGLHNLEQKLNEIGGLNTLYLRAGYF